MSDDFITLRFDNATQEADLEFDSNGFIRRGDSMDTLVTVTLYTDARVTDEDIAEFPIGYRRGWWGDSYRLVDGASADAPGIGSRLWVLGRRKLSLETVRRVRADIENSLAWLVANKFAASVTVTAQRMDPLLTDDGIETYIVIKKPDGEIWQRLWRI